MNSEPDKHTQDEVEVPASSGLDQMGGVADVVDLNHESVDTGYFKIGHITPADPGPSAPLVTGGSIRENASRKPVR